MSFEIDATTFNSFMAALTTLILLIIAWLNKKRTDAAITTATATTQTAQSNAIMAAATPATSGSPAPFDPGFSVLPTDRKIKSGQTAGLNISAGLAAITCAIDWQDGTAIELRTFADGMISAVHTYLYVFDGKHTAHQFYPVFTLSDRYGQTRQFNNVTAAGQGACCAIEVQAA